MHFGKMQNWVELPNSGDLLKIIIPSYILKVISGWTNYPGMVTSYNMSENEMENRGSKSNFISKFVKEQRVDGSWRTMSNIIMRLRCILTGCESSYQVKYLSNLFTKIFSSLFLGFDLFVKMNPDIIGLPAESSAPAGEGMQNDPQLNPWYLTGITDAEGTFTVAIVKEPKRIIGWRVLPKFQIGLHVRDKALLLKIQAFFGGIGSIGQTGDMVHYSVSSVKDLVNIIIPHFNTYFLLTQKGADFILFKAIVELVDKKAHLSIEGLQQIVNIKASLNLGLSAILKSSFNDIKPVDRPVISTDTIPDPYWVTGFVDGEATFDVKIYNSKNKIGQSVQLRFRISQHERDTKLMGLLIKYLACGVIEKHSKAPAVALVVTNFTQNIENIIPFFVSYPLVGVKKFDFLDWCEISKLISSGAHLTIEGFDLICSIKAGMNASRKF